MTEIQYPAYLRIRKLDASREIIHSVGVSDLSENYVEKVMCGMVRNMDVVRFFIDDSEVDAARSRQKPPAQAQGTEA